MKIIIINLYDQFIIIQIIKKNFRLSKFLTTSKRFSYIVSQQNNRIFQHKKNHKTPTIKFQNATIEKTELNVLKKIKTRQ